MDVTAPSRRHLLASLCLAVAPIASSCRGKEAPSRDSAIVDGGLREPVVIGVGGKPICPGTGHWTSCAVLKRLESAGVAPQAAASLPDLPPLGPPPMQDTVGRSGLAIYLFADSAARATAGRTLDTLHFVSAARALTMRGETTAIQSDNLLALLFSRNEQQRERVSDALTAGPPQPERP